LIFVQVVGAFFARWWGFLPFSSVKTSLTGGKVMRKMNQNVLPHSGLVNEGEKHA
jgi:branched-subunit amino acid transport protein AzlD